MKKIGLVAVAAAVVAGGLVYFLSGTNPKLDQYQGALVSKPKVAGGKICVQKVGDYSKKSLAMEGVDEMLVDQLRRAGLDAALASNPGGECEAVVHTEIVDVGRKSVDVDFRLASKKQEVPILSASAKGKSNAQAAPSFTAVNSFLPKAKKAQEGELGLRDAMTAAFGEQSNKIAKSWSEFALKSK